MSAHGNGPDGHGGRREGEGARGLIFDLRRHALHDGPGIRTVVFFKGCPLSCAWCHNPEGMAFGQLVMKRPERCIACGRCGGLIAVRESTAGEAKLATDCPSNALQAVGTVSSADALAKAAAADEAYYRQSGGGVTFSGGEPLAQGAFLLDALERCGALGLHRAVDTSGYSDSSLLREVAARTELFLYDIKCMDPARHLALTGVGNELILSNLELLRHLGASVQPSVPVIPGANDDRANMEETARLLADSGLGRDYPVRILPFHDSARAKYERLGLSCPMEGIEPPSAMAMNDIAKIFRSRGLRVSTGGLS